MPGYSKVALFSSLIAYVSSQQVGTLVTETHPNLPIQICTASGCTTKSTKIVLDANWRWAHNTGGSTNCYTGNSWSTTYCANSANCVANCALEGADYSGTYGITTSGNALTIKFVTRGPNSTNIGSRVYLLETDTAYEMFKLNNREFTFDVDTSGLPCGLNGALYFVEMDKDGGLAKYPTNKVGARYGTGYCDAQCPHDIKWMAGKANIEGWNPSSSDQNAGHGKMGACCAEMDIWEANSISNAYTPHTCKNPGLFVCESPEDCGDGSFRYQSQCDKDGCDINPFRTGNREFYGPGKTVNTNQKMTVVTQFITSDGTDNGDLVEIKRFYVQNGVVYATPGAKWSGIDPSFNSITDEFCRQQKNVFTDTPYYLTLGGNAEMGRSHQRGHVLAMSLWADHAARLLWLDAPYPVDEDPEAPGVARGTCSTDSGDPADMVANHPNASVTYSNIKFGSIGSTFSDPNCVACPVSRTSTRTPTRTTTTASRTPTRTTTTASRTPTTTPSRTPTTTSRTPTRTTTTASRTPTTTRTTTPGTGPVVQKWGQCGGIGHTGGTTCVSGSTCTVLNPYYSQCL